MPTAFGKTKLVAFEVPSEIMETKKAALPGTDNRTQADSKFPLSRLSPDSLLHRARNLARERKALKRGFGNLRMKLKSSADKGFLIRPGDDRGREILLHILTTVSMKVKKECLGMLVKEFHVSASSEDASSSRTSRKGGSLDTSVLTGDDDAASYANEIMAEIDNHRKGLEGNDFGKSYSPQLMRACLALFIRSSSNYEAFKKISPFCIPSSSRLRKIVGDLKVEEGKQQKTYGWLFDRRKEFDCRDKNEERGVNEFCAAGYLMCDEIYLLNLDYFFNQGKLSAAQLHDQVMHVIRSCEFIGARVYGLCADAAGPNAALFSYLTGGKQTEESWLPDEYVSFVNPCDPSRRVALFHCMTHGGKSMRNQLRNSRVGGTKQFRSRGDDHFGWKTIEDCFSRDSKRKHAKRTNLEEETVHPSRWSVMNVGHARRIFEDKTLNEILEHVMVSLGMKAKDFSVKTKEKKVKRVEFLERRLTHLRFQERKKGGSSPRRRGET